MQQNLVFRFNQTYNNQGEITFTVDTGLSPNKIFNNELYLNILTNSFVNPNDIYALLIKEKERILFTETMQFNRT